MLEKLFLFCKGYLILKLEDVSKERLLNLCKTRKIEIIDIISINNTVYCKMPCKDYRKIKPLVRKTGCCPKIEKKVGVPFLLKRIKMRKGLLVGGVLGLFLLLQCTGRIWYIDVEGGFLHTRNQMVQILKSEMGVYGSVGRNRVDCAEIERRLRLIYPEIGWVSVEKRGCNLYIKLNESTMPGQVSKTDVPCHIIAEKDGIVRGIEVISGIAQVQNGDVVLAGDILISGIVPVVGDYDELIRNNPVGAAGTVTLETDFTYQLSYPMEYDEKTWTKTKYGIGFFWLYEKLFSYIPRYSEGKYDIITFDMVPFVFRDFEVPFRIRKYEIKSYELMKKRMSETEAEKKAETDYRMFLDDWKEQGIKVIKETFSVNTNEMLCEATAEGIVQGNFISYQEIMEEEWQTEHEYSGDNP